MKTPCRQKGCDRTFKSQLAERMHYHRVHSGHIVARHEQPKRATVRFGNGSEGSVALMEPPPKIDRRRREWRQANPDQAKQIGVRKPRRASKHQHHAEVQINYCPQCGCHIHAVAMGMAVATHIK
jgi:hypothetical protein